MLGHCGGVVPPACSPLSARMRRRSSPRTRGVPVRIVSLYAQFDGVVMVYEGVDGLHVRVIPLQGSDSLCNGKEFLAPGLALGFAAS